MCISQKGKGVIMRNLRDTAFHMKTNELKDFHIYISVSLNPSCDKHVPQHEIKLHAP